MNHTALALLGASQRRLLVHLPARARLLAHCGVRSSSAAPAPVEPVASPLNRGIAMQITRTLAALALVAAGLALAPNAPAGAEDRPSTALVTTDEQNCHETNILRAVLTSQLDALVPDRYTLLRITPTASRFIVTTVTCFQMSVDGQPAVGRDKPTTISIGSAVVTHRDGQQLPPRQQQYIVWYGTDNPVLFAKLQQTGLPVSFLPRSSATITSNGATSTITRAIRGAGLDYDETAVGIEPTAAPQPSTSVWWHDGPKGDLRITYNNQVASSTAVITADFRSNEVLSQIIALPNLLQINGSTFGYVRGSWTSEVSFVD